jgi:hypothetical protein
MEVQSKADLKLISGDPGTGKTTTGVKYLVDDVRKYKAHPNPLLAKTIVTNKIEAYKYDFHIFSNAHLFGMKYMFLDIPKLAEYFNVTVNGLPINDPYAIPLIGYGDYLIDEAAENANARRHNSADTMLIQNLVTQSRKRHLKIIFITQDSRLLSWEAKRFVKEWVECERPYPNSTIRSKKDLITLTVKKEGKPQIVFDYHGSKVWPFFKSDQLHPVSNTRLAKAIEVSRVSTPYMKQDISQDVLDKAGTL